MRSSEMGKPEARFTLRRGNLARTSAGLGFNFLFFHIFFLLFLFFFDFFDTSTTIWLVRLIVLWLCQITFERDCYDEWSAWLAQVLTNF